jgi:hypothetical protein
MIKNTIAQAGIAAPQTQKKCGSKRSWNEAWFLEIECKVKLNEW